MCDQRVILMEKGKETVILESVERMETVAGGVRVMNIFGEEKTVNAVFHAWSNNTMILQPHDSSTALG